MPASRQKQPRDATSHVVMESGMPREQQSNSKEYVPPTLDPVSEADDSDAIWFEEDDYWGEPVPEEPAQ